MLASVWLLQGGVGGVRTSREATKGMSPLLSLHAFWSSSTEKWNFHISPDGKQLAWLGDHKEESAILYETLGETEVSAIHLGHPLDEFWWAEDSRHVLFLWDEHGDDSIHLWRADTDRPEAPPVDLTPYPGVLVQFHQSVPSDPAHLLIQHNRRDRAVFDLYRLNVDTWAETLVATNPGDVLTWITNPSGEVLARSRQLDGGGWTVEILESDGGGWKAGFSGKDDDDFQVVGHPLDGHEALALSGRGRDRTSLVRIDLATGHEELLYEDPRVDVDYADTRYATNELLAAFACPDYWRVTYFDEELEEVMNRFTRSAGDYAERFDMSRDERLWIINTESDTEDTAWYLYDTVTKQERLLYRFEAENYQGPMAHTQPIEVTTQDGLVIHGYLTIPVGSTGSQLPTVVRVHDGPRERVYWEFNRETQFLANRGYAVLEVNFRGSGGYGKEFRRAGIGEFASAMHSDVLDAVSWAVSEGVTDPDRVAIYGWGYGGYEALVAASYTPDVFAAAIDAAGPTDWVKALESMPPYMQADKLILQSYLGNPATPEGHEMMRVASPSLHLDRIVRPLLVVQGGRDAWGIQGQVEEMVERLRERDAPVEYLFLEDEGRSIQHWENHLRFYRVLESFLAKHLGGRVSPITADEMWLGLQ